MTGYDQAQSPRLGQRVPYEGTTVQMFTGTELPEVSVTGQIIWRKDTKILQVYNPDAAGGIGAWEDVAGGVEGTLTYVGDTKPATPPGKTDDIWYDTANGHLLHIHDGTDFQPAPLGLAALDPEVTDEMQSLADAAQAAAEAAAAADATAKAEAAEAAATAAAAADAQQKADDAQAAAEAAAAAYADLQASGAEQAAIDAAALDAQTKADAAEAAAIAAAAADATAKAEQAEADATAAAAVDAQTKADAAEAAATAVANTKTDVTTLPDDLEEADLTETEVVGPTVTAGVFQTTASPNQGLKMDADGFRAYAPGDPTPFMNVDPVAGMVIVAGEGTFEKLTANETSEFSGSVNINPSTTVNLNSGAVKPSTAPKLDYTYTTQQFTNDGKWVDRRGWEYDGSAYMYTTRNLGGPGAGYVVERWSPGGTLVATSSTQPGYEAHSMCIQGSRIVVMAKFVSLGDLSWYVQVFTTSTMAWQYEHPWMHVDGSSIPAVAVNADQSTDGIVIAQSRIDNTVRFRHYTLASGGLTVTTPFVDSNTPHDWNLAGLVHGIEDLGIGNCYTIASKGSSHFAVIDPNFATPAVEDFSRNWPSNMTNKVGFYWNGSNWMAMDRNGVLRQYTALDRYRTDTDNNLKRWVGSTYCRVTSSWETEISPVASIYPPKRSKLTVTAAGLPASPGVNDPNEVRIYIGSGSTYPSDTNMIRQPALGVGVVNAEYSSIATTPDNNPPPTNNFPGAVAAKIVGGTKRADGFTPMVKVEGNGVANVDGLIPPGTIMMWAGSTAPTGWKMCDGSELPRNGVDSSSGLGTKALADVCLVSGSTYRFGNGNGTDTFNLPNLNNRLPIGAGTKALGTTGGAETKTIGTNHLPPHTHPITRAAATGGNAATVARGDASAAGDANTGGGGFANDPLNIMPPWLAINFIIKL